MDGLRFDLTAKQKIAVACLLLLVLFVVGFLIFSSRPNPLGDDIRIQNYDKYIGDLPGEKRNLINYSLLQKVRDTYDGDKDLKSISDALIRDGSLVREFDEGAGVYYGSFIVDIESVGRSYRVVYEWPKDGGDGFLSTDTNMAVCLAADQLIYGDFKCADGSSFAEMPDDLYGHLPYTSSGEFSMAQSSYGEETLAVRIALDSTSCSPDEKSRQNEENKMKALKWISDQGFDPNKYFIFYSYTCHSAMYE